MKRGTKPIQDEYSHIPSKSMRLYYRRVSNGVCPSHPDRKPVSGHIRCAECMDYKKAHFKKNYKPKKPRKYTPRPSKYLTQPTIITN